MCSAGVCFMAVSVRRAGASDLTSRMVAFAFAGIVTRESSQISVRVSLRAPFFRYSTPPARMRWPIETPVMTPALMRLPGFIDARLERARFVDDRQRRVERDALRRRA